MAKVLRRPAGTTAITVAVLVLIVVVSSAVPTVGAGRPGRLRAVAATTMRMAATKPDQTTTTAAAAKTAESSAGPSGCTFSPNNPGGRCPHHGVSSSNPSPPTTN